MKSKVLLLVISMIVVSYLNAQTSDNAVTDLILNTYSEKAFTSEPISNDQLEIILKSGIKAPSARNMQPWKFTVIRDEPTMKEIVNNILPGNVLVVVSGLEAENGTTPDFDCGLATENMFTAAHSLGLGARIYGSPVRKINLEKELYQIPSGYKVVVVLRIGNIDKSVDAVTSASPRKNMEEIVNFKN